MREVIVLQPLYENDRTHRIGERLFLSEARAARLAELGLVSLDLDAVPTSPVASPMSQGQANGRRALVSDGQVQAHLELLKRRGPLLPGQGG